MNYIRYFLYGTLVVICLLLWNIWQKENINQQTVTTQPEVMPAVQLRTQVSTREQASEIRPTRLLPTKQNSYSNNQKNPEVIHVKTDVLDVDIDTIGGNIIGTKLLKYPEAIKSDNPYILLNDDPNTVYISQSGLITSNDKKNDTQQLQFYANQKEFNLTEDQKELVVNLNAKENGLQIIKTYTFKPNKYNIEVTYQITNKTGKVWNGNYYMQLTRADTLPAKKGTFSLNSFFGVAISSEAHPYQKFKFTKLKEYQIDEDIKGGWVAMVQHYFIGAWIPDPNVDYHYFSQVNQNGTYTVGVVSPAITINPDETKTLNSNFYAGPKIEKILGALSPHLALTIDYGWLWFISILLFKIMKFFYGIVGNWGWSIIIVTILIKAAFYHLSTVSYKSMAAMRKLQPKISQLRERFKDDKQALSKATMELYRKEKINPLGGCLPIVIQIPVFFALYWVLIESVELRQAPFALWIHDLSAADPYYILPILMGLSMYVQQKLTPQTAADPTMAKMMMFLPVIMTVFFLNFPSGLVLYWLVNNVISVLQQWYITRKYEHGDYKKKNVKDKKKPWWMLFSQRQ